VPTPGVAKYSFSANALLNFSGMFFIFDVPRYVVHNNLLALIHI
jgi:hypothetical protein